MPPYSILQRHNTASAEIPCHWDNSFITETEAAQHKSVVVKYASNSQDLCCPPPPDAALTHSKLNCSARLSFQWVVVCPSTDTEDFLWAAPMKVFLPCWLCYFQQKDGVRHNVYVFTWHSDSFHLSRLQSRGELFGWQTVNRVQDANCLCSYWQLKNWLRCFSFELIYPFQLQEQLTAPVWFETELSHFVISDFLCVSPSVSLWNTDTTPWLLCHITTSAASLILKAELPVW